VIPNAIDPNEFPVAPMPPDVPPIVGVVANLHPYKRHDLFLRTLKIVAGRLPTVRAVFVGDGVARPRLEQLTTELGLADHVTFAGQVSDTRPLVAGCHVVALTSSTEGFPNALLEAMSQARPVVATRVGGAPELVRHGLDGFLTSDDPAEIAARIRSVLVDRDLRTRMASSARERAGVFSWDKLVRDTESVYREVLAMPRGSSRPRSRRSDLAPHVF
jgi:glycosyltransferase involved in cell wall biosynthesis